jgi:Ca-activated chloride channel family protein
MRFSNTVHILCTGLVMFICQQGFAQWIDPRISERVPPPRAVGLSEFHMEVKIQDQVAEEDIELIFHNPNPRQMEGDFFMEIEPGTQVDKLTMMLNGRLIKAELVGADRARQIYESIVRRRKDPVLLEYFNYKLIRARVFPIPPNGNFTIQLRLTKVLKLDGGLVKYRTLNLHRGTKTPSLREVSLEVTIESKQPIRTIYSPTHSIDIARRDENTARVSFEQTDYLPEGPFILYYTTSGKDIGLTVLTYREEDEKGFFMLALSPKLKLAADEVIAKDIVFCVDTSGSMAGKKIQQTKEALKFCIQSLNQRDRFNIIDFSTEARSFRDRLVPATQANKRKAIKYIKELCATGSTAIQEALTLSLEQFQQGSKRSCMIAFMTDGRPNIGESDPNRLCQDIRDKNDKDIRIFVFGVGHDVNTRLLDMLSADHKGTCDYIAPNEDIEGRVSSFYGKVANPILSDIKVRFEGIRVEHVYPKHLPDLFCGTQVVIFGRYEGEGTKRVTLSGNFAGSTRTYSYEVEFPEESEELELLPRLWAGRRVAFLLDELRRSGKEDQEVIKEITDLARRYGIVTPYTSYLITDDNIPNQPIVRHRAIDMFRRMEDMEQEAGFSGRPSFEVAKGLQRLKGTDQLPSPSKHMLEAIQSAPITSEEKARFKTVQDIAQRVRYIGNKVFYYRNGTWYDSTYDPQKDKQLITIKYMSDEYIKLATEIKGIARYLVLGDSLILKFGGKVYKIERSQKEGQK